MTPQEAVKLARSIYSPVEPKVFDSVQDFDAVTVGLSRNGGTTCITFAGSETSLDWVRDFTAEPFHHPDLGTIHEGFWQGMQQAFISLRPRLSGSLSIQGHSLGCAHSAILAGLCAVNGIAVDHLFLYAPPRPGYAQLSHIVRRHCGEVKAYRNGCDPVPEMPIDIPFIAPWKDIAPLIALNSPPDNPNIPTNWHAIDLYVKGVSELAQPV